MKRETVHPESDTGFTFIRGDKFAVLKHPDGGVKKVPERFVDDLARVGSSSAEVAEFPADFRETVDQLREEGYIYRGPVTELYRPEFSVVPRLALAAVLFTPYVLVAGAEVDRLIAVLSSTSERPPLWLFLYGPLVMLPTVVAHEWGHYREAGKHVPVSFGIGTINGLIPAFKTYTTETWLLSPAHRMWVNLAGVTYQSVATMPVVALYYLDTAPPLPGFEETLPWLLVVYIFGAVTFTLNPIYHGDGYLIMTDLLGEYNIRKKARRAYRERTLNMYAVYGFVSYGLVNVYKLLSSLLTLLVWGWVVGGVLIGINLVFVAAEFTGSRAREFVASDPEWVHELRSQIEPDP